MKTTFAIALAVFAFACAPNRWVKPGGTQESFNSDKYACQSLAGSTASGNAMIYNDFVRQCMEDRGWRRGERP